LRQGPLCGADGRARVAPADTTGDRDHALEVVTGDLHLPGFRFDDRHRLAYTDAGSRESAVFTGIFVSGPGNGKGDGDDPGKGGGGARNELMRIFIVFLPFAK